MSAKKKTTKKKVTTKNVTKKKTVAKKTVAKKKPASKKKATKTVAKKKVAAKKTAAKKKASAKKKSTGKKATSKKTTKDTAADDKTKETILSARTRKQTPSIFKVRNKKNTPIVFTLDDVNEFIKEKKKSEQAEAPKVAKKATKKVASTAKDQPQSHQSHKSASLADILGFNPNAGQKSSLRDEAKVPKKWMKYYKELIALRTHVSEEIDFHSAETLKRSSKDDSGDLSGYGQHMADAGTDAFDRDFALSLVSSEQEALYEIEEAIQRILKGTYGVCEITGEAIPKERLMAVPFTRYSLEGQRELESNKRLRKNVISGNVFADATDEDAANITDDDA